MFALLTPLNIHTLGSSLIPAHTIVNFEVEVKWKFSWHRCNELLNVLGVQMKSHTVYVSPRIPSGFSSRMRSPRTPCWCHLWHFTLWPMWLIDPSMDVIPRGAHTESAACQSILLHCGPFGTLPHRSRSRRWKQCDRCEGRSLYRCMHAQKRDFGLWFHVVSVGWIVFVGL